MTLSVLGLALAAVAASESATKNRATRIEFPPRVQCTCRAKARPTALHLFFDAGSLAREVAQIVELGATHVAAALHGDRADRRAVRLEHALHAFAVRNLAHGERRVEAAIAARDDDAFVGLHALAVAFLHLHLDDDGVAGREVRNFLVEPFGFELGNDVAHVAKPVTQSLALQSLACSVLNS